MEPHFAQESLEITLSEFAEQSTGQADTKPLNRYFHELYALLRKHLVAVAFEQETELREILWERVCADQGWESYLRKPLKDSEWQSAGGIKAFDKIKRIAIVRNAYFSNHHYHRGDTGLDAVHSALDRDYLLLKLMYSCASLNASNMARQAFVEEPWLKPMLAAEEAKGDLPPVFEAYQAAYSMLHAHEQQHIEAADGHFEQMMRLLRGPGSIERDEAIDLHTYALNHLILRVQQGLGKPESVHALVDDMLDRGVLLSDNLISPSYYKLITSMFCRAGMLQAAEDFVEGNHHRIVLELREECYFYNQMVVAFHKGDMSRARKWLYDDYKRYKDLHYDLGARVYRCKIAFRLGKWEVMELDSESMRLRLLRLHNEGKISDQIKAQFDQLRKYAMRVALLMQEPEAKREKGIPEMIARLSAEPDPRPTKWMIPALRELLQPPK